MLTYQDSFWSTEEGIYLIEFCHRKIKEVGVEKCIEICKETGNEDLIPVFEVTNEKTQQNKV